MQWVECPTCHAMCQAPDGAGYTLICKACHAEYQTGSVEVSTPPTLPIQPPPTALQRQQQTHRNQICDLGAKNESLNPIAIVSLVLSCMATLFVLSDTVSTWFPLRVIASPIGGIMGILIVIISSIELKKIERGAASANGKGMVMTGFILGIVSAAMAIVLLIWCLTARAGFRNNIRRFSILEHQEQVDRSVEQIISGNRNGQKQDGLPSTQESLDNIREYKKTVDGLLDGSVMKEK